MKWKLCLFSWVIISAAFADEPLALLTVTGQGKTTVKATLADIRMGIEVDGKTAVEVQQALADRLKPILDALKQLKQEKIETSSMNIIPEYNKNEPPQIVGYRGVVEISMTKDASEAGQLIDEIFKAGANRLVSISMKPSDSDLHDARNSSLQKACVNALEEAEIVSKALNLTTKGIHNVDIESGVNPGPVPLGLARNMSFKTEMVSSTEILAQEQIISASINVKFNIQP
jgi:uncharacterized protein YggE